uniref:Ashwin n=1 Tax=Astyanax mexicanus TaxID=7994 RepID=A0A3B1JG02_ASTMX
YTARHTVYSVTDSLHRSQCTQPVTLFTLLQTVYTAVNRDQLTDLYIQHVIPLPQRELPNSRWGKRMEKTKARQSSTNSGRKRPLIVFDGSSSSTGSVKLKKPDDFSSSAVAERLKPPPSTINLTNPIRKLSGSSTNCSPSSSTVSSTQTPASASGELKSPEVKKKIQHVTWP